jgi:hypothetical protein
LYRPARHSRQRPHGTPGSRHTRSPIACDVTSRPTAATRPAHSCPSTSGDRTTRSPMRPCSYQCTSEPQTPTDVTATSTSRGAGSGIGRRSIAISPGRMSTAARLAWLPFDVVTAADGWMVPDLHDRKHLRAIFRLMTGRVLPALCILCPRRPASAMHAHLTPPTI